MIRLEHVSKSYGSTAALREVTLHIRPGEIMGLVGPDGAGKTTLLRLITGVLSGYDGSITVGGTMDKKQYIPSMAYVPQRFSLYKDMTVMENIRLMGALYGVAEKDIEERAAYSLTFTGLYPFRDRLAGKLSGGMKQKLALSAAILHTPKLFILDEPTTGVDPNARREFWQLLYELNRQGMTILAATPYMDEAALCHRIALMWEGTILRCASPKELLASYPYTVLSFPSDDRRMARRLAGCYFHDIQPFGNSYRLITDDPEQTTASVLARFQELSLPLPALTTAAPTLEDVFLLHTDKRGESYGSHH